MLHIHNGDSSANIAKQSTIPGEHFAWREALIEGPTPEDVSGEQWRRIRAKHLSEYYGVDLRETERELETQEDKLAGYVEHDEVVLWFEHDLFCQINLLYLLNWFAQRELGQTKLSLIFIGKFPGLPNFRGLGELNPAQMASLLDGRLEVAASQLSLSTNAWQAYCSPDPTTIERFLQTDTSAITFLQQAFRLHLERFPFVSNGLGRIQNRGLEFVSSGLHNFIDLFPRFVETEPAYGLGDSQFWMSLRQMSDTGQPLLKIRNGDASDVNFTAEKIHRTKFEITEVGTAVLGSEADFVDLNGLDAWLGGVHLNGKTDLWRWDQQNQRLERQ